MVRETQSLREKYGIYYLRYLEIRSEWHPTKNGKRKLSDFSPLSSYSAWWKCKENHVWRNRISNRMIRNQNCKYCYRGDEIITDHKKWSDFKNKLQQVLEGLDFVPNREQLSELGHTQLVTDIGTVGTLIRLYAELGSRYPRLSPGYWTKDKLLAVIKPLCQELGHVPTHEMMAEQLGRHLKSIVNKFDGIEAPPLF